jgi:ribosomal protein L7/L12
VPGEFTTEGLLAHFDGTSGDKLGAIKKMRELTGVEFEQAREVVAGL